MASYSNEFRSKIIARMLPPNNESIARISAETQVSVATLNKWRKKARESGQSAPAVERRITTNTNDKLKYRSNSLEQRIIT